MEQPTVYNTPDELIAWLKYDLIRQVNNHQKDEELTLNIRHNDRKIEVKFNLNFYHIIFSLPNIKISEKNRLICHYKVNCANVDLKNGSNFGSAIFNNSVDFNNTLFNNTGFINVIFNDLADFHNAIFDSLVNFNNAIFNNLVNFSNTSFNHIVSFSNANFNNKCFFHQTKIKNTLDLYNINFNEKSYIEFINININYDYDNDAKRYKFTEPHEKSKINIVDTVINGRIDFNNVKIKNIDFEGSSVMGAGVLNRVNLEAECANWETATFLKNEELKRNNTIKALEYKAIEKDLYEKELMDKNKSMQVWGEILSIKLSKLSNNHGQDWLKALRFTAGFGAIFLILSYIPYCINIIFLQKPEYEILLKLAKNIIPAYFEYLIPTKYNFIPTALDNTKNIPFYITSISSFFYFAGKIAIGYGMVEIVQAFRKLNSK